MNSCRYRVFEMAVLNIIHLTWDTLQTITFFRWGKVANQNHLKYSSKAACHDTYIGHQPWSEPEAVAIRDFILNTSNAEFKVTIHCYTHISQMLHALKKI